MKNFRLQTKNFFLTFPTVKLTQDTLKIINLIKNKEKHIKYILVALETHQNNDTHYHIFLHYSKRKNIINPRYFDYIFNQHGDYQKAKSVFDVIQYIKKDGNFQEWGNCPESNIEPLETLLTEIKRGNIDSFKIIKDDKLKVIDLFNKIGQIDRFEKKLQQINHEAINRAKSTLSDIHLKPFNDEFLKVLKFIKNNLSNRPYKAPILHIWSKEPDTGKTSLINLLYKNTPCYLWPDDMWFQEYKNDLYQFILWDEFNLLGWKIPFLNRFFAGNPMNLPVKGTHAFKKDNPLIILTSNQPLIEHIAHKYPGKNPERLFTYKTLLARIHEIEIKEPFFQNFHKWKKLLLQNLVFELPSDSNKTK